MKRMLLVSAAAVAVIGCRTNKAILDDYEKSLTFGRYAEPVAEIAGKADEGGVDELMWRLHLGSSRYLTRAWREAVCQFDLAEDLFADHDGASAAGKAVDSTFAMLTNDRAFTFTGTGSDRVFVSLYKAIDYGANNEMAAMRTELNRAAEHQNLWLDERRAEIARAARKLNEDARAYEKSESAKRGNSDGSSAPSGVAAASTMRKKAFADADFGAQIQAKCAFNPATDGHLEDLARKDWINVYAEHVTGVFRWLSGDSDAAAFLRETAALRPANAAVQADYAAVRARALPKDRVWVFVEDGLCPTREEWRLDLPIVFIPYANRYVLYAGMALPYLRDRDVGSMSYHVDAGGAKYVMEEIEDLDRLIRTEYKVYMRGCLAREITRTIIKVGSQVALGIAAEHANDARTALGLRIGQASSAAWAAAVTQADLRSWTALPKRVLLRAVKRPANGVISLSGDGMPIAEIPVPEGNSLVFVRKPARAAAPVVKVVTFPNR